MIGNYSLAFPGGKLAAIGGQEAMQHCKKRSKAEFVTCWFWLWKWVNMIGNEPLACPGGKMAAIGG